MDLPKSPLPDSIAKQKIEIAVAEKELTIKDFFAVFPKTKRAIFLILVILIIPIFFIAKFVVAQVYLSSFAKTQITSHQAILQPLPVQISETRALTLLGDSYSAYSIIKNPNKDLVSKEVNYTFRFFDAAGKEIGKATDKTYLLAGEEKYLVLPNIRLTEIPQKVQLEIPSPIWKRRFIVPNILIRTGIPRYQDTTDPVGFSLESTISNLSNTTIDQVKISAIVFDAGGKVLAVNQRIENTLIPKENRDYKMSWPIPLAGKAAGAPRIVVETNVLDLNNLK
jgi:hypothetical protein